MKLYALAVAMKRLRDFQVFCVVLSFSIAVANLRTLIKFGFVLRGFLIAAIVSSAVPVVVALILDTGLVPDSTPEAKK